MKKKLMNIELVQTQLRLCLRKLNMIFELSITKKGYWNSFYIKVYVYGYYSMK